MTKGRHHAERDRGASPKDRHAASRRPGTPTRCRGYVVRYANGQACPIFLHHLMQDFGTEPVACRVNMRPEQ
jgi:hypothetical protein